MHHSRAEVLISAIAHNSPVSANGYHHGHGHHKHVHDEDVAYCVRKPFLVVMMVMRTVCMVC